VGLFWAFLYSAVESAVPGSFSAVEFDPSMLMAFVYFSFVTMTTLGYGDITATTEISQALVIIETLMGQLYLAILIARLVSLHAGRAEQEPPPS
jgi:hypothetical protein